MASQLPATETVVDLTQDDGDDEPEVLATSSIVSPRASTLAETDSRLSTSNVSPEKQSIHAPLHRSEPLLAAQAPSHALPSALPTWTSPSEGVTASPVISQLASPSKQSLSVCLAA